MTASTGGDTSLPTQLAARRTALERALLDRDAGLLAANPPQTYLDFLQCYRPTADYAYVSPQVDQLCRTILQRGGQACLALYHRLVLTTLIDLALTRLPDTPLPDEVKHLYLKELRRILSDMDSLSQDFYRYPNDPFKKDLALCRLKLIPAGACLVADHFVISKRFLLKQDLSRLIKSCHVIFCLTRGFHPYYRLHIDSRWLSEFNPEGWSRAYLRIARMLEINRHVKGLVRSAWFLDPQLETISPHLAYLRKTIEDNGGYLFRVGTSQEQIHSATVRSSLRRKLYEEGQYMPTEYLAIWPRQQVLQWAAARHAG